MLVGALVASRQRNDRVFGSLVPGSLGGGGAVDLEDLDASQVQPGTVT
jgi:hypothetical protein